MNRNDRKLLLAHHAAAYPALQAQDIIKYCYQATYGAEHLLADEARARAYFEREWEAVAPTEGSLWEALSSRYVRVHLGAWKAAGLPREWLFTMFRLTASTPSGEGAETLQEWFAAVEEAAQAGEMPFSFEDWAQARETYERADGGSVHHSEVYRVAYAPAYRVTERIYVDKLAETQQRSVAEGIEILINAHKERQI